MYSSQEWWSNTATGGGNDPGDPIGETLRFRGSTAYLENTTIQCPLEYTFSAWVKTKGPITSIINLFGQNSSAAGTNGPNLAFTSDIFLQYYVNASFTPSVSTAVFRDPSAWYHVVAQQRSDGFTAWVNGESVLATAQVLPGISGNFTIHRNFNGTFLTDEDCYMADVHFIDGQTLDSTTFGRYNANGVWVPRTPVRADGTTALTSEDYGTNGFHLDFHDPANIGEDVAPTGTGHTTANNFTANGFDTTSGDATYDIMQDSPTNNFATINPLFKNGSTKDANLTAAGHTPCWPRPQTIAFPAEGSHMFEWQTGANTGYDLVMISADPNTVNDFGGNSIYIQAGQNTSSPNLNGSYSQVTITGPGTTFQPNNYYQVSWDGTSMRLYQEGALVTTYTNFPDIPQFLGIGNNYDDQYLEFGQRGFKYPIAGFEPLSTAKMFTPTIANGRDHFRAITDTGANILTSAQGAFASGLWWIKDRANANQHQLVDVMNGTSDVWYTPAGTGGHAYAAPAGNSVAWCWLAGDSNVANTDGTVASTVRANNEAGFSIVRWNGAWTTDATAGHGLTQSPDFVIYLGYTGNLIAAWHSAPTPAAGYLYLNSTIGWSTNIDILNSAGMTATTIGIGSFSNGATNTAYVWHSVPGYSAFGSYAGNASDDGPFVYTGFRPAFVLLKCQNAALPWSIFDSTRNTHNPANLKLYPNGTGKENEAPNGSTDGPTFNKIDMLSNGFKLRGSYGNTNGSNTYVYAAFAENPFQAPVTAR